MIICACVKDTLGFAWKLSICVWKGDGVMDPVTVRDAMKYLVKNIGWVVGCFVFFGFGALGVIGWCGVKADGISFFAVFQSQTYHPLDLLILLGGELAGLLVCITVLTVKYGRSDTVDPE